MPQPFMRAGTQMPTQAGCSPVRVGRYAAYTLLSVQLLLFEGGSPGRKVLELLVGAVVIARAAALPSLCAAYFRFAAKKLSSLSNGMAFVLPPS